MSEPRVALQSLPGLTQEQAREARARAWAFIFDCYAKKKGGVPSTANDPKEIKYDRATAIVPE